MKISPAKIAAVLVLLPVFMAGAAAKPLKAQDQDLQETQYQEASAAGEESPAPRPETGGLQFSVPEDWPIEKRGGAVGPIPIEDYMKLRFDRVNTQIQALEARVQQLEEKSRRQDKEANSRGPRFLSAETVPETEKENP